MQWSTCTLSGQPLRTEVVADYLGALYNREAVLEFLLMRSGILADDDSEVLQLGLLSQLESAALCVPCTDVQLHLTTIWACICNVVP